ncbi:hypothetical protein [Rheinheimera salexigens]|uniref:Uncharacterized protein n=1 Tax=Rheinheimera salexigens TaxID=1628148 RepID=A0A1E7Q6Q5_9GAMM|nr:hypothetical protein [Rheinheimera salexigens]OEY69728.1 hypothetical protein BI198_09255 [Rheinheimera salexigens]
MLVDETLVGNTRLLLQQRLQLVHSRYVGLQQLRQHDLKLIANIKLIQQRGITPEMPLWLQWIANTSNQQLSLIELEQFLMAEPAWLLLHEIKALLQPEWLIRFIANMQRNSDAKNSELFWPLAIRLQLKLDPFHFSQPINAAAIWYVACSAQPELHSKLVGYSAKLPADDLLLPLVHTAIYSYQNSNCNSEWSAENNYCEVDLVQQLVKTEQLQAAQLILLLTAATETKQNDIITLLINNINTQSLAILALAITGKTKFITLLLELAQQPQTSEAAADSLACILGVIEADTLLCDVSQLANLNLDATTKYLSGKALSSATLGKIWQQGNQQQRRIAACYARLSNNNISWREPDTLLGGIWHNQ